MFLFIKHASSLLEPSYIPVNEYQPFNITEDNVGRHIVFSTTESGKTRINQMYIQCSIQITNSEFTDCDAFATSAFSGCGGIIYGKECQLLAESLTATNCAAVYGGSIYMIASTMLIHDSTFNQNTAYRTAGAIFYRGGESTAIVQIYNTRFQGNVASNFAGAMTLYGKGTSYFDNVTFIENCAGIAGGAIDHCDNSVQFFDCTFESNTLDADKRILKNETKKYLVIDRVSSIYNARGGSSIFFINNEENRLEVFMQKCCFKGNKANQAFLFSNQTENATISGYNLVFSGNFAWTAMHCCGVKDYSNIKCLKNNCTDALNFGMLIYDEFECGAANEHSTLEISLKEGTFSTDLQKYVPEPTLYATYLATPITQLPLATTASYHNLPAKIFKTSATQNRLTLEPTPLKTPTQSNKGKFLTHSITQIFTEFSTTIMTSVISSSSIVYTEVNDTSSTFYTYWYTDSTTIIMTEGYSDYVIEIEADEPDDGGLSIPLIIGGVLGIAFLLLIISIISVFITRKRKGDEEDDDVDDEMTEIDDGGAYNSTNNSSMRQTSLEPGPYMSTHSTVRDALLDTNY